METLENKKNKILQINNEIFSAKTNIIKFNNSYDNIFTNKNDLKNIEKYLEDNELKEISIMEKNINNYRDKYVKIMNDVIDFLENEKNDLEEEIKKIESDTKKSKKINNLYELYNLITNSYQQDIFTKILNDSEYAKLYLAGYQPNEDNFDIYGTINVLGTYNHKKDKREEYEIKIYKNSSKGSFWCSCPDHKFNSSKKGTVCKHICFIVCKILKYMDPAFFETKKLSKEQIDILIHKLSSKDMAEIDKSLINKIIKVTLETFMNFTKQIDEDDCCPICFDSINDKTKLACPMCHNYIHAECMDVCLEKRNTCLFCMDPIWDKYKKLGKKN